MEPLLRVGVECGNERVHVFEEGRRIFCGKVVCKKRIGAENKRGRRKDEQPRKSTRAVAADSWRQKRAASPRTAKIEDDIVSANVGQPERKDVARDGRRRVRRRLARIAVGRLARVVAARELAGRTVACVDEDALKCGDLRAGDRRRPHALELLGGARSELKVDHFPRPHHAVVPGLRAAELSLERTVTERVCEGKEEEEEER